MKNTEQQTSFKQKQVSPKVFSTLPWKCDGVEFIGWDSGTKQRKVSEDRLSETLVEQIEEVWKRRAHQFLWWETPPTLEF